MIGSVHVYCFCCCCCYFESTTFVLRQKANERNETRSDFSELQCLLIAFRRIYSVSSEFQDRNCKQISSAIKFSNFIFISLEGNDTITHLIYLPIQDFKTPFKDVILHNIYVLSRCMTVNHGAAAVLVGEKRIFRCHCWQ